MAVADGETLKEACDRFHISITAFKAALKREKILDGMFLEALETRDDILADMLVNIDKTYSDPKMASVVSANVRFILERRRPEKYGKVAETNNPSSEANRLLAAALAAAVDRIPHRSDKVIDVVAEIVEPRKMAPVLPAPGGTQEGERGSGPEGVERLRALGFL